VYGRTLPILRGEAERILREVLDPEVQLRWMRGVEVEVVVFEEKCAEEYSDGSRAVGSLVTAAATRPESLFFGRYVAVMGAEEARVMLAWKGVALDSQGAVSQLGYVRARSWIGEELQALARRPRKLMWVKGHSGTRLPTGWSGSPDGEERRCKSQHRRAPNKLSHIHQACSHDF